MSKAKGLRRVYSLKTSKGDTLVGQSFPDDVTDPEEITNRLIDAALALRWDYSYLTSRCNGVIVYELVDNVGDTIYKLDTNTFTSSDPEHVIVGLIRSYLSLNTELSCKWRK